MKRYAASLMFLSVLGVPSVFSQTATTSAYSRCEKVLELTGKDVSVNVQERKIRLEVYENLCNGTSAKEGLDFSLSGSAIIDLVPVEGAATFASRKEKVEKFCKTYDSKTDIDAYNVGLSSTVVRESIGAWERCMNINQSVNIAVTSGPGPEGLLIELTRMKENATFQGIDVHSGAMNCTATAPLKKIDGSTTYTAAKNTTTLLADGKSVNVSCTRTPKNPDAAGNAYYPPLSFSILTDRGSLFLNLPDNKVGPDYLSQWLSEKAALTSRIGVLSSEITALRNRSVDGFAVCSGGPGAAAQDISVPSCPAGTKPAQPFNHIWSGGGSGQGWKCMVCTRIIE
jgi:hypothetical protein